MEDVFWRIDVINCLKMWNLKIKSLHENRIRITRKIIEEKCSIDKRKIRKINESENRRQ